jgi:predicted AlkP superfamily pyrophosphatase or phosphodiesterase
MIRTFLVVLGALVALAGCARQKPPTEAKLLIVGLDCATWNVLTPMLEAGELPTLGKLVKAGSSGVLKSGTPIQSPQMWTSIATGKVPEKHGIEHFVVEVPGTDRQVPVSSNMRKVKAFWNILSEKGISVGVVGWWPSWPAEQVDGFMISDRAWPINWSLHGVPFGASRDAQGRLRGEEFPGRTYPEALYKEFEPFIVTEEDVTPSEIAFLFSGAQLTDPARDFHATWVYAKDKTFAEAGLHFLTAVRPRVMAVYFQGIDVVQHNYWGYRPEEGLAIAPADAQKYGSVVKNYYQYMDRVIADYVAAAGPDYAVLIVSDHGFETKQDLKEKWLRGETIRTDEGGKDVPWDHAVDGTIIMAGPGIQAGHTIASGPSVVDVTPTILAYLGLPVGKDMDGRPITEVFEPSYLRTHPIQYLETYETGERPGSRTPLESPLDEGMKEKLRALGYIE